MKFSFHFFDDLTSYFITIIGLDIHWHTVQFIGPVILAEDIFLVIDSEPHCDLAVVA